MKALVALVLTALLVLAPYTVVLRPAGAVPLKSLPMVGADRGECPKGAYLRIDLADGSIVVLGENGRAILAESGAGSPVVTHGTWDSATGELTLYPKTKHQTSPDDSLCADLFPEDA
jgi:hypothetical protein